jgi:hypothetical protein
MRFLRERLGCFPSGKEAILPSRERVRLSFTGGDQLPQVLVHEHAPCAGVVAVALEGRNQADMRQADFRFALFLRDIEDDVGASPLILFPKAKAAV